MKSSQNDLTLEYENSCALVYYSLKNMMQSKCTILNHILYSFYPLSSDSVNQCKNIYTKYNSRMSTTLVCRNFDKAMPLICRILSLESFNILPISSQDRGGSPLSPKCNLNICSSRLSSDVRSFSSSCFISCFFTIFSGVVSSGPDIISCKRL